MPKKHIPFQIIVMCKVDAYKNSFEGHPQMTSHIFKLSFDVVIFPFSS